MSYIITDFPPEQVAKGFSLYMLLSSAAVIFGPTLGGIILSFWNWRILMWISSAICIAFYFICQFTFGSEAFTKRPIQNFDFGVAVFVPMFTNEITRLSVNATPHLSASVAAVSSIHMLATIELFCVATGIVIVQFLPKIYHDKI